MIHAQALAAVCGEVQSPKSKVQGLDSALRSPGLLKKHYSPKARLVVLNWRNDADLNSQLSTFNLPCHRTHHDSFGRKPRPGERDPARCRSIRAGPLRGITSLRRGGRGMDCGGSAAGNAGMVGHCRPAAAGRRVSSGTRPGNYFCSFQRSASVRNIRSGKKPVGEWFNGKLVGILPCATA